MYNFEALKLVNENIKKNKESKKLKNKIKSGYNLREIIEMTDELPFGSSKNKHELSHLYETKIKNMGNAGRNGGQYYTPRPLIRAMIEVVEPKLGQQFLQLVFCIDRPQQFLSVGRVDQFLQWANALIRCELVDGLAAFRSAGVHVFGQDAGAAGGSDQLVAGWVAGDEFAHWQRSRSI